MKYVFFILTLICFLFANVAAQSDVSEEEAILVAKTAATNQRNSSNVYSLKKIVDTCNNALLYEIIMEDGNVLLLSGNKACIPILGSYIYPGLSIVDDFDLIPDGLKCLVGSYIQQVAWCNETTNQLADNPQWNTLINGNDNPLRDRLTVGPLLHSKWGQTISNDLLDNTAYNEFAPDSGCTYGSVHCPAGCVAVAMGQIMKYWSYPFFISSDNDIFDWCNMSDELRTTNPCYDYNKKAINKLLKACGKSVNMSYGCDGSGASTFDAENAFRDIFHYDSRVTRYVVNMDDYYNSYLTMCEKIVDEIDEKRPVLISAHDFHSGGHSFVCDGYRTGGGNHSGELHLNWGWNGDFDGFFVYDQLNPSTYTFVGKGIVYNIMPDINYHTQSIVFLEDFYSHHLTIGYYPYRLVPEESDKLYSASISSTSSWRTIPNNTFSIYQAHEEIELRDGFIAERGSDFIARIVPCHNCENRGEEGDGEMVGENEDEPMDMAPWNPANTAEPDTRQAELHPNPTDGELTMAVDGEVEAVVILDINGNPQGGWEFESISDKHVTLNVSRLKVGAYILTVRHPGGNVESARFIKQ